MVIRALLLSFLFLTVLKLNSVLAQRSQSDSLSIILYLPGDSAYWYLNEDIRSSQFFHDSDTIQIHKEFDYLTVVPKSRRSSSLGRQWLLSRANNSKNGKVGIYFNNQVSISANPEYQFIESGYHNLQLIVADGEQISILGQIYGSGNHQLSVPKGKVSLVSKDVSTKTRKRYRVQLEHNNQKSIYVNSKPHKWLYYGLSAIPGASQFYTQRYLSSLIIGAGALWSTMTLMDEIDSYNSSVRKMKDLQNDYQMANDYFTATELGDRISIMSPEIDNKRKRVLRFAGISGSMYLLHWVSVLRTGSKVKWYTSLQQERLAGVTVDF